MEKWGLPPSFDGYEILKPLGSGAMGRVYLAHERALDRVVAIKVLAPVKPNPTAHARFLIEARAIARLQHPNVVAIAERRLALLAEDAPRSCFGSSTTKPAARGRSGGAAQSLFPSDRAAPLHERRPQRRAP